MQLLTLMKAFLIKYKLSIIYWALFVAIVLYFVPRQHDYYLDNDIVTFKKLYLRPALIWIGVVTNLLLFVIALRRTKSLKESGFIFLFTGVLLAFYLFILQDLFLGASLFI